MGRDKHEKERHKEWLPPFVPLVVDTLDQPAWRAMSHGAQMLYVALKRRPAEGCKRATLTPQSDRTLVSRVAAFRLHCHADARLPRRGRQRQAPRWRLTELGYMNDSPTRDYARWDGKPFVDQIKSRARKRARGVLENEHGAVRENRPPDDETVQESPHKEMEPERAGKPAQNYITTPDGSRSAPEGSAVASEPSSTVFLVEQLMHSKGCSREEAITVVESLPEAAS